MEAIKKGSIESLLLATRDRLGNISTLTGVTNLVFDVKKKSDDSAVQTGVAVQLDSDYPMTAICSIDTTLAAYVADQEYKLYLKYFAGSEAPIKGPVFFRVVAD